MWRRIGRCLDWKEADVEWHERLFIAARTVAHRTKNMKKWFGLLLVFVFGSVVIAPADEWIRLPDRPDNSTVRKNPVNQPVRVERQKWYTMIRPPINKDVADTGAPLSAWYYAGGVYGAYGTKETLRICAQ